MVKRGRKIKAVIVWVITIIVFLHVLGLFVDFGATVIDNYRLQQIEAQLEREVEQERALREELLRRAELVQQDEYVEEMARKELNWVRPGDVAIIPVPRPRDAFPTTAFITVTAPPTARHWWDELWQSFWGGAGGE